jgi:hypothetical protein
MMATGLREKQVAQVRGFADQRPRVPNNPTDDSNRRISVIVQYLQPPPLDPAEEAKAKAKAEAEGAAGGGHGSEAKPHGEEKKEPAGGGHGEPPPAKKKDDHGSGGGH